MAAALEVVGIKKNFIMPMSRRKVRAISDLSFKVEEGQIVGFLGANGAGKTTTLKIIMRLIFANAGTVKIFGQDHRDVSIKNKIGFLTERPYFYDYLTGREFLTFCAHLFRSPEAAKRVGPLLEEVGLAEAADRPLRRYSKGMLQRVGIAQALINNPKFIILDEPMSGLDPDGRADMAKIILNYHKKGATVLFSTHLLNDVEAICERVVMIDKGQLILEESVAALLAKNTTGYTVEWRTSASGFQEIQQKKAADNSEVQRAVTEAVGRGDRIERVQPVRPSMEEIFVRLKRGAS